MNDDPALAAVVAKERAEECIAAFEAAGVYDDARRVRERDEATVELPIIAEPDDSDVLADEIDALEIVEQSDPDLRLDDLESHLRERGWTDAEIRRAPNSWAVVGSVVLVQFGDCPRREEVGNALLSLHGEADTVLARSGVSGKHREPDVSVVAGAGDTETVHVEHGTRYALDFADVMFSPGNQRERVRMGEVVEDDDSVFDMFAGVGYFTLPMARAGADVTAVERNPASFQFLVENAVLNRVQGRIDAYRADCRDVAVKPPADRVVMGHYDAHEYLDAAFSALKSGGTLHFHATTPENRLWDRPVSRLEDAASDHDRAIEILGRRKVKSHSEGVWHVVVDARVE